MIVQLALATQTSPRDWWDEDDATIATAIELLEEMAEEVRRHGR